MSDIGKSLVTELDVIKNRKANPQRVHILATFFLRV